MTKPAGGIKTDMKKKRLQRAEELLPAASHVEFESCVLTEVCVNSLRHDPVPLTSHLTKHHSSYFKWCNIWITCSEWSGVLITVMERPCSAMTGVCVCLCVSWETQWITLNKSWHEQIRMAQKQNDCKQTTPCARETFDLFFLESNPDVKLMTLNKTHMTCFDLSLFMLQQCKGGLLTRLLCNCLTLNCLNWHFIPLTFGVVFLSSVSCNVSHHFHFLSWGCPCSTGWM